ncbi:MAG: hypothetical protein JWL69_3477 [Phycisphaerales bacterium]|nr:hypothetical protein [Phycisphaerales bacterium]
MNLIDHSPRELMGHLEHAQAAPPVFLWIERGMYQAFGSGELSLRLLPLVCGVTALALFAALAWRLFTAPVAVFATGLFAFCGRLIAYSAEVKQYEGDVLAGTLLLFLAAGPGDALRRLKRVTLVAAVLIWFSHSSVIVFAGISLALTIRCIRDGSKRALAACAWNLAPACSLGVLYMLSIRPQHNSYMFCGWAEDFPDFGRPLAFPAWLGNHVYQLANLPFKGLGALTLVLAALGCVWLVTAKQKERLTWFLAPIGLTLLASCLKQYPFNGSRLTLFLLPGLLLLVAFGAEGLYCGLIPQLRRWWWMAPLPLAAVAAVTAGWRVFVPQYRSHIRPVVAYVREHRQPGEAIYLVGEEPALARQPDPGVFEGRHLEFLCYWRHPPAPVYDLWPGAAAVPEQRFWLAMPIDRSGNDAKSIAKMLADARTIADEVDHFDVKQGAAAYLFQRRQLSPPKAARRP